MENIVHISVGFHLTLGRIYYFQNEFHCFLMDNIGLKPFSSRKVVVMADYLLHTLSESNTEIDWRMNYPTHTPKKKQKKIHSLVQIKEINK